MTAGKTALVVLGAALALNTGMEARGDEARKARGVEELARYCDRCHGPGGQGRSGPGLRAAPQLAGQTSAYTLAQLRAFAEGLRKDTAMHLVALSLRPAQRAAVAGYYAGLATNGGGVRAPAALVAAGKTLYEEGFPAGTVPACASCHGADARGAGEVPRLAGQLPAYTQAALASWSKARGEDATEAAKAMRSSAAGLTKPQMRALAAYLGSLP